MISRAGSGILHASHGRFALHMSMAAKRAFIRTLLLFRKSRGRFIIDVAEPHRPNQDDTYAKTKGLAEYAETYGGDFGQLMILKIEGAGNNRLLFGFDVNDRETRKKASALRSNEDVQALFKPVEVYPH